MDRTKRKICFLLFLCLLKFSRVAPWMHHIVLDSDNKFHLRWYVEDRSNGLAQGSQRPRGVVFETCVETHGWIGFGLSPSGGMTGSDLVIAWVDSQGQPHVQDRYAEDEEMPVIDDSQDWILKSGFQNDTHTCVTFLRDLLTCDYDNDLPITKDVTKLIWAYGLEDPIGSSALISKHQHHHRGHRSVHLLNHKFNTYNTHDANIKTWDITSQNFVLSHNHATTYWCKIVKPTFNHKAHVIRIEPIISPAKNAPFVHHMVLYRCLHPRPELLQEYVDQPGMNCLDIANMPFDFYHCQSIYMVWATGGEAFDMPQNVGIPIFEDHETSYFMFEIHYDNPELRSGVIDSSGFRLFYTEHLREFAADTATMGSVADYRLIIPNGYENFTVSGHCSPECFREKIPKTGLNVLAVLPHGHKHLERIVVRHFRGNNELPHLAEENNYDFNFQDFRRFDKARVILPGDQITVECTYNTEALDKPIFGGLSTQEEMCIAFFVYYPRMKARCTCLSGLSPQTVMKLSNVDDIYSIDENDMDPTIVKPRAHANKSLSRYVLDKMDWAFGEFSDEELTNLIRYAPQKAQCFWRKIEGIEGVEGMEEIKELITYPRIEKPYVEPKQKCFKNNGPLISGSDAYSSSFSVLNYNHSLYLIFYLIYFLV